MRENMSNEVKYYYSNQSHRGSFELLTPDIITAFINSSTMGRAIRLQIKTVSSQLIVEAKFKVQGCPYTIAVVSYLCNWMINKMLTDLDSIQAKTLEKVLKLPEQKFFCALLGEEIVKQLLEKNSINKEV